MAILRALLAGAVLAAGAITAHAAPPASALRAGSDYVEGEVLVVPAQSTSAAMVAAQGYTLLASHGGKSPFLRVKLKPGESVSAAIGALSTQPWAIHVQPNYIYHAMAVPNDPGFAEQWGYSNSGQTVNGTAGTSGADIAAVTAWNENTDCSAVTVAVIDSGVDYNHPELSGNIWSNAGEIPANGIDDDGNGFIDDVRGWDFVQGDNDPMDFNEHGTHVAGTIGAAGNNASGVTGVCWVSSIMPLRVLDSVGSGTTADITAAIDYAVAKGARVINMSLGGPGGFTGDILDSAISAANAAGLLVVVAAGNDGTDNDVTPQYPASYAQPNILVVAATTQSDVLASFSNFGATTVDMAAPGTDILSTVPPARAALPGCSWNFDDGTLQGWSVSTWDTYANLATANTVAITTESAASPLYSLTDSPGANYANDRSYRAVSPVCDLTGTLGQGVVVSYMMNLDTESGYDGVLIDASSDGVNWGPSLDGWSGTTSGAYFPFDTDMASMEGIATAQVRFHLETDFSIVFDGVHLDDIAFTVPNTSVAAHSAADFTFLDGTSMASPHVAGAAALVWAADPALTNLQLKDRLMNNGKALAALSGITVSGRRLDLQMAMPLHAPTALTANAVSYSRVDLAWADNSISEKSYEVQRDYGLGFATVATLAADTKSYSDRAALAGIPLKYRIVATGADGRTSISASVSVTTPAAPGGGGGCLIGTSQGGILMWVEGMLMVAMILVAGRRRKSGEV